MRKNRSGEDEQIWKSPQSRNAENGAGETVDKFLKNCQPEVLICDVSRCDKLT
jgi:hypothetical protein